MNAEFVQAVRLIGSIALAISAGTFFFCLAYFVMLKPPQ